MEQPDAAERHGDAVLVAGVNDLLVADGAAGLDDGRHAGAAGTLDVVAKGEERVRAQADARYMAQVLFLLFGGQRRGLLGKGLGPDIVANDILRGVADVNINGVVPVGLCHIIAERQVEHLVHVAQLPVVGFLAGQTGAVDAALLAGAHADGLTIIGVAHAVGLGKAHTVILSSHILSEVQAVCQQVLILSKGHLVAVGSPEELGETLNPGSRLRATAQGETDTVLAAVRNVPGICRVELESAADGQVTFTAESEDAADRRAAVSRALTEAGCTVLALAAENRSLEEVFLALTEKTPEQNTPAEGEEN